MNKFRLINDNDMIQEFLEFRDDKVVKAIAKSEKPHTNFENFKKKILDNTVEEKKEETRKIIFDYNTNNGELATFFSEIYYRNGFIDAMQFILACMNNDTKKSLLNGTNENIKELFLSCINEEKS